MHFILSVANPFKSGAHRILNYAPSVEHETAIRLELHKSLIVPPIDFHFFSSCRRFDNDKHLHGDVLQIAGKVDKTVRTLFVCVYI